LDELLGQASAAERAVVDYKAKNNIVDNTAGHTVNEQKVSELNSALIKARADTMEVKARLDRVSQVLRAGEVDPAAEELGTIADTLRSEIINNLRLKYLELARRESIFSNEYGSTHLAVVKIRNEMAEVRHSIVQELKRIAQAAKSDYEIAKARENSLESSLAATVADSRTTDKAQIQLRQLESAAQTYRGLYETFQQRYIDSIQQQSLPIADARIVSRASPPDKKSYPKSLLILAAATMGGLVLGVGLGTLREISDRGFRTNRHVEAKLKSECIALVPMDRFNAKAAPVRTRAATECADPRTISPGPDLFRYLVDSPLSPYAESIRAIKVNIDRKAATNSGNVIGITSSLPNEGKSTIAASLAQVAADGGARVILVDCDLRKPSLSRELAPNATHGLVDVLKSAIRLEEVIWSEPSTHLSFLPAGIGSRFIHTNELLASDAMKRLFVQLRESYDYVIVDLSPVVPVVDVRSATHLVDSFVFVIEWGKTKVDVAEHSLHSAHGIYENLVGVVLNKVSFKLLNRYEGHGNYYDHRYYIHYGYTD
jgi:polysaccharide biosynthesis transport protein